MLLPETITIGDRNYPSNAVLVDGAALTHTQAMWVTQHFGMFFGTVQQPSWLLINAYVFWTHPNGTMVDPQRGVTPERASMLATKHGFVYRRVPAGV